MEAIMRTRLTITLVGLIAALAVVAIPASAATNVHRATLSGSAAYPNVKGSAKSQRDNGVREFEAEIEHAKPLAGSKVRFKVDGTAVGTATVSAVGRAHIDRRGAGAPSVSTGSKISVRKLNGALVASGRFS
jgi:hypothetical protein